MLTLTNTGISANPDILSGATVLNEGTISVLAGTSGGERRLETPIDNKGTVALATGASFSNGSATFTNEGALKLESGSLAVSSSAAFTNGAGGSIAASAGYSVFLGSSATYNQGAGTTSGTAPVVAEASTINYTGSGASVIHEQSYYGHLTGNISHGQSLIVEGCVGSGNPAIVYAKAAFENAGTIEFTSADHSGSGCGSNDYTLFKMEAGTLTNTGTIMVEPGIGGERTIEGSLTNQGTVDVNAATAFSAGNTTFDNEGALKLESGSLAVSSSAAFTNGAGGSIAASAGYSVFLGSSATYNQGAGTTSGVAPVVAEASNINYTGSGASVVRERSYYGHMSGNIAHGQSLIVEGCVGSGNPAIVYAKAAFENAGTIEFTSADHSGSGCGSNDYTLFKMEAGTLTNTGTILVEPGIGGERTIEGSLTNQGTVDVNAATAFSAGNTTFTNEGAVDLEASLSVQSSAAFTNGSGGSIDATGSSAVDLGSSATYNQGAGTTSGAAPVVAEASTINYTGSGASVVRERSYYGHLTGNISHGQSLIVEGCVGSGNPAIVYAKAAFENAGTIELTSANHSGSGCGTNDYTLFRMETGTLTNTGTILVEPGIGGERKIEAAITNRGAVDIDTPTVDTAGNTTFINEGAVNLAASSPFSFQSSTTFTNGSGGLIDAIGDSSVQLGNSSTFNQGAGSAIGNEPIVAEAATINYTGSGASVIHEQSYYGHLTGNISQGQTLVVEGCVGSGNPAIVYAKAAFENAGTIELTSADHSGSGCGTSDYSMLRMEAGTLTNTGTILVEPGIGGERKIEGAFDNERFLSLSDAVPLTVSGTFTQGTNGTLIEPIASTSSYGEVSVSGKASLGGTLDIEPLGGFKGELGQKFTPITDASHENAFIHEENAVISSTAPGLWYKPVYEPTHNTTEFGLEVAEGSPPEKPPVNEVKPSISGTPRQGNTLVAAPGTWKGEETTAYSYQWARCTAAGTECKAIPGAYYRQYLLTGADAGHRLTVGVTAYNEAGGSAAAEPASPTEVIAALPLQAKAGETVEGIEGSQVTLDGSGSTPSSEITTYKWKFGDGSEGSGASDAILHHVYAATGTYAAQLTVSGKGEESNATVTVKIHPKPKPAEGAIVTVKDGGGAVQGASVLFVGPTGTRIEAQSSSSGEAVLAGLPEGNDSVYVYKSGDKPAVATVAVDGAGNGSTTVTLSSGEVATTELKSKELDYKEVVEAGINPYAPENQNVYSFTVKLAFIESPTPPVELHGYVNGGGAFVGGTGGSGGGGFLGCDSASCEFASGGGGGSGEQIVATPAIVEHHPLIQWLILKGKAAVLKQFFEVSMLVQNLSPKPFTLSAGTATLNLPAGLSLAPTAKAQHLTEETPAIEGESSYTANWIIRGDTPGEYPNLSATYNSTLEPFLAPVDVSAALAQPLKVWGKEALQLKVKADEGKLHPGVPYHVWIGVKNVADVPLYNLGLSIEEEPHLNFLFQPDQQFSEVAAEVKPGETFWVKNPYILIPNEESESVFNPSLSSITFDGEKEHPGENIEKVPFAEQPHLYPVSAVPDTPGYVHLKWTAVPGAEGYEVFSTKPLVEEKAFSTVPRKVFASSSLTGAVEELPGTATEAYVPASSSETLSYAVSTLVGGHHELESSPVVEAAGVPASTTVVLTSSGSPSVFGQKVTFTAKATPAKEGGPTPTGTVSFREGATVLGSGTLNSKGVATFISTSLGAGEHTITAAYGGDIHNAAGESSGLTQMVSKASTQVVLTSSANPTPFGSSASLQATVKAVSPGVATPAAPVTFMEGATVLATVTPINGVAKYSLYKLSAGEHTITATYLGGANTESSKSSYVETVSKASTQVVLTSSANPTPFGSSAYLQATVKVVAPGVATPAAPVTFMEGTTVLATIVPYHGVAKYSLYKLSAGEHTITATYTGGTDTESSKSSYVETVSKAFTQVVLTSSANPTPFGSSAYLQATVTAVAPGVANPEAPVTFMEGATVLATVNPTNGIAKYPLKKLAAGEHTITATYAGGTNTESSKSSGYTETIDP